MIVSTVLFIHCSWPDDIAAFFSGIPSIILISRSISRARFLSLMMYHVAYGENEMIATDTFSAAAAMLGDAIVAATAATQCYRRMNQSLNTHGPLSRSYTSQIN